MGAALDIATGTSPKILYAPLFGSFLPVLIKAIQISDGPVLEMGMGVFSTPVMHWLCLESKRPLVSFENDVDYFNFHSHFYSPMHNIRFVADWDAADIESTHWGVALIDHAPGTRRIEDIKRLADKADFIIVHDTEKSQNHHYHYDQIFPLFKYHYQYRREKPYTSVLSNLKEFKL